MTINKGEQFNATYSSQTYAIAGKWCGNLILAPTKAGDGECLIYSAGEMEELLATGKFIREAGCK